MVDMNEKDIIGAFQRIAEYKPGEDSVGRDLQKVRDMLTSQHARIAPERESIWRIIMKSKWTKMTSAAAVIIIAISMSFSLFTGPELKAAELLAEVAKNMEKLAWVKTISKSYVPDKEEPVSTDIHWTDVRNKRVYAIYSEKYIHLMDYNLREWSVYRPETNDMVVKPLSSEWTSPSDKIEMFIKQLEEVGVEVTQSEGQYNGKKTIVIQYDETNNYLGDNGPATNMMMGGKYVRTMRFKIIIYDKERLMGAGEISYLDDEGNVITTSKSESQAIETGPGDIYELGVPRDVKIINKVPSRKVKEIHQKISEHKSRFLNEYIAVITEARIKDGEESISEGFVIFCQDKKLRVDVYKPLYGNEDKVTGLYENQLDASLGQLKPFWPDEKKRGIRSVRLYDGLWQYILEVKDDKLTAREKQRRPDGDSYGDDDLDDFTWRTLWWLNDPEHMYEDDYSRQNGLIAMELTTQSLHGRLPKRQVLYVDPEKDYVCHRYVNEKLIDAPWQEDKGWLDAVENKDRLTEEVNYREVIEYGQTLGGQWYPKVITEKGYRHDYGANKYDVNRIIRIHLISEHPSFPEGIFDLGRLPEVGE